MKPKRTLDPIKRFRKRLGKALVISGIFFSVFSAGPDLFQDDVPFRWPSTWRTFLEIALGWAFIAGTSGVILFMILYAVEGIGWSIAARYKIRDGIRRKLKLVYTYLLAPLWNLFQTLHLLGTTTLVAIVLPLVRKLATDLLQAISAIEFPSYQKARWAVQRGLVLVLLIATSLASARTFLTAPATRLAHPGTAADAADSALLVGESSQTLGDSTHEFRHEFRLKNSGVVAWRARYLCREGPGSGLTSPRCVRLPDADPGDTVRVSVPVRAPNEGGTFTADFKIVDNDGRIIFPDVSPLRVRVNVLAA
jgi:hypothetical protein